MNSPFNSEDISPLETPPSPVPKQFFSNVVRLALNPHSTDFRTYINGFHLFDVFPRLVKIMPDDKHAISPCFTIFDTSRWQLLRGSNLSSVYMSGSLLRILPQHATRTISFLKETTVKIYLRQIEPSPVPLFKCISYSSSELLPSIARILPCKYGMS